MPNLVGIGNTQVPTNAMLGGLAYQDPAHANLTSVEIENIAAIKAKTSDNAVGIFVYDTRKDSDGGAWRKRTSHTSWYNEAPSATRGARKEFPAVAVIVVTGNADSTPSTLVIYDGDDPNLPLWIQYNRDTNQDPFFDYSTPGSNHWGNYEATSVSALNGIICAGTYRSAGTLSNLNAGVREFHFIEDACYATNDNKRVKFPTNIADRYVVTTNYYQVGSSSLVDSNALDVAMTVLPNAPIDSSTGLPIPTIAVATDGGVSVIKDDGTVVDIRRTSDDDVHHVAFDDDRVIMFMELGAIYVATIPSADQSGNPNGAWSVYGTYSANSSGTNYPKVLGNANSADLVSMKDHIFANAGTNSGDDKYKGLSILAQNVSSSGNGMVAWIKSDFNTGWMHGDIKGAFLSDTDDTNITGTSLIANGDFSSSSTAAFTTVAGGTAAVVGGLLKLTDTAGAFCYASAPFTTVVGNQYFVTVDIVNSSNTAPSNYIRCGNSHNGTEFHNTNYGTGYGTKTFYLTATATTTYLTLISGHGAGNPFGHWDNVFAYKLDNDRSINTKGLLPYGTITKSAVATGAELVAYSGFTTTNHLEQNDNHLFGTGDFCFIFWVKLTAAGNDNQTFIDMSSSDGGTGNPRMRIHQMSSPTGSVRLYTDTANVVSTSNIIGRGWTCVAALRRDGGLELYINGELEASGSTSTSNFNTAAGQLSIGLDGDGTDPLDNGSITLVRSSPSAPSAEQIKKMYNDEKHLFQENAKCTLYGSSNEVTAVAYDDSNDILHAGTSGGRSEFVGLNRINNTTTAVTTVISASNGLVAEQ